ncbi:sensor histidine kinase [Myxococcus xanthus]|uniref:sensor histidine kinase n=1 Tax=Myxococcus xanthus TaxID=34 RepID=UPI00112754F9|nr:HAMP domain-containing sensor histidine kinase [Myxococcus xanthus]QDF05363.1 two-component sensor histidine kinase [Myxococcus xanthus]
MDSRTQRYFEDIQLKHFGRLFGRLVRVRLFLSLLLLLSAVCVAVIDGAPWRCVFMSVVGVGAFTCFFQEFRRFQRDGVDARSVPLNLWMGQIILTCIIVGTGGIASPVLPAALPLGFLSSLTAAPRERSRLLMAQLSTLMVVSFVQISGLVQGLPLWFLGAPSSVLLVAGALVTAIMLCVCSAAGGAIRTTFDNMLSEALASRDELLATHRSYAGALEAMSGEIAHELKNPLATVKGLTQLMAREAGRAQPAERLQVLSGEVVRMQGILEEFLNFTRPLVPLTVSSVDLGALCDEALVLHEGLAAGHGVRLDRKGTEGVAAMCDSRKVKQVLMNLLHNAIEASPAGGRVTVEVRALPVGEARVSVRDAGPGLASELVARVFDAGVTTKAKGSGLGLTVARALARQHGGDVTLANAVGGGCEAALTLPRELPAELLRPLHGVAHVG